MNIFLAIIVGILGAFVLGGLLLLFGWAIVSIVGGFLVGMS